MRLGPTLVFETWRLAGYLESNFAAARKDFRLNQTQFLVLLSLRQTAHVAPRRFTPTELSTEIGLPRSTVSMQLPALVRRGLVVRSTGSHARASRSTTIDRRTRVYQLTSKGQDVATELADRVAAVSDDLVKKLSAKRYMATMAALQAAYHALGNTPVSLKQPGK